MDYVGLAALVTAIGSVIVSVGTLSLQCLSLVRQTHNQNNNSDKLDSIHDCLHEQTAALKKKIEDETKPIMEAVGG